MNTADCRPGLAVITNVPTPYRMHLHQRIAQEIPELKLHSIFTRGCSDFTWNTDVPEEINAAHFGDPSDSTSRFAWRHPIRDLRRASRIIEYLTANNVRAVLFNIHCDPAMLKTFSFCHRHGIRTFVRSDSNIRNKKKRWDVIGWLRSHVLRRVLRRCDVAMPMGELGQRYFEKHGADPEQCIWVPYEPDYELFSSVDPAALAAFRAKHSLSEDRRYLLFSGRLVRVKRVDLLLDAFAEIAGQRPSWDVVLAGDGPLRADLERRVPQGLRGRVRWLGFCEVEEVRAAYHAAQVLVLPSESEPWALVVNEAMAAGLPVVASDVVGAAHELVRDGHSGRIFATGDVPALTAALLEVTDDAAYGRYRTAVGSDLSAWRRRCDPVEGVRRALVQSGILAAKGTLTTRARSIQ